MQEILCNQLVSDPSGITLSKNCRVRGIRGSSLVFELEGGIITLKGRGNPNAWTKLFSTPHAKAIRTQNLNSDCLYFLPDNIDTIIVDSYQDLNSISEWLHNAYSPKRELTVEYDGTYEGLLPPLILPEITKEVSHLFLPFSSGIEDIMKLNTHIRGYGFDFDHNVDQSILETKDTEFLIWSLHPHNHYLSTRLHPKHQHRLFSQ